MSEILEHRLKNPRTPEQRAKLLVRAKILDENGHYHPDFFSEETVAKSKANKFNDVFGILKSDKSVSLEEMENAVSDNYAENF